MVIEAGRNPGELRFATGPGSDALRWASSRARNKASSRGRGAVPRVRRHRTDPARDGFRDGHDRRRRALARHLARRIRRDHRRLRAATRHPARPAIRARDRRARQSRRDSRPRSRAAPRRGDVARCRVPPARGGEVRGSGSPRRAEAVGARARTIRHVRCAEPQSAPPRTMLGRSRGSLFERALVDKDACVRYYAVRGLAQVGVGRAAESVEKRRRDDDLRVRLAAIAALEGKTPSSMRS